MNRALSVVLIVILFSLSSLSILSSCCPSGVQVAFLTSAYNDRDPRYNGITYKIYPDGHEGNKFERTSGKFAKHLLSLYNKSNDDEIPIIVADMVNEIMVFDTIVPIKYQNEVAQLLINRYNLTEPDVKVKIGESENEDGKVSEIAIPIITVFITFILLVLGFLLLFSVSEKMRYQRTKRIVVELASKSVKTFIHTTSESLRSELVSDGYDPKIVDEVIKDVIDDIRDKSTKGHND